MKISGKCLGEFIYRQHVMPREQLQLKESSLPLPPKYIDVVRQTTTNLDKLGECSIDDIWNIDDIQFSLKVEADSRDSAS